MSVLIGGMSTKYSGRQHFVVAVINDVLLCPLHDPGGSPCIIALAPPIITLQKSILAA